MLLELWQRVYQTKVRDAEELNQHMSQSRLDKNCQHLGLSHLRLATKTAIFGLNCASQKIKSMR